MKDNRLDILDKQKQYIKQRNTIAVGERIAILKRLRQIIQSNEDRIKQALYDDLHKNSTEAYMTEIGIVISEINYCIKHLKSWL